MYKAIGKIIEMRLKFSLVELVNVNQTTFMPDRSIQDNLMTAHELIKGYNRKLGWKKYALKVDIKGACDTANREDLIMILRRMRVPKPMLKWVIMSITSPRYSILVKGRYVANLMAGEGYGKGTQSHLSFS